MSTRYIVGNSAALCFNTLFQNEMGHHADTARRVGGGGSSSIQADFLRH